jgi:hypothetical protein
MAKLSESVTRSVGNLKDLLEREEMPETPGLRLPKSKVCTATRVALRRAPNGKAVVRDDIP